MPIFPMREACRGKLQNHIHYDSSGVRDPSGLKILNFYDNYKFLVIVAIKAIDLSKQTNRSKILPLRFLGFTAV